MKHLPGLDLLRALAIVWVMCFHAFLVGGLGPDWDWLSRFDWPLLSLAFGALLLAAGRWRWRLPGAARFPVYAAATLLLGAALHYGIERPGLRWRDRLQPSWRPRSIHAESTP